MKTMFAFLTLLICSAILSPAARAQTAAAADVTGKWHVVLDTEGGDRTAEATFQVHDGQVTGKWDQADVHGTFANGKLNLSFTMVSDEAGEGTLAIKGDLTGDTLKGDWSFQTYTGTFKATRVPSGS